jgi:hypothetical protein
MANQPQNSNFHHLSVKDLIEARDMFHVHLINKNNVVATAIGRYLIRHSDLDENGKLKDDSYQKSSKPKQKPERTINNSMVLDISWPCILVFVEKWESEEDLIKHGASNIIPKSIYMPDGRVVPVCTVVAPKVNSKKADINLNTLRFPENLVGGGFPVLVDSQGKTNVASIGCIVTDGHTYYALTNKHVAGGQGQILKTFLGNKETEIGKSSGKSLGKIKFNDLYQGWKNDNLYVSCDAGLIEINDVNLWKTDILGLPPIDEMFDINTMNLTLGIIAEHKKENNIITDSEFGNVIAYGAVSGELKGEISALFYRYKTLGGIEYVSDFLISGRNGADLNVHHGDSGTVWLLENQDNNQNKILQPIALHWGQHKLIQNSKNVNYAYSLSTCLSNICREMEVEIVRDWNLDLDFSWGESGHYTIGNRAVGAVNKTKFKKLAKLMANNANNISYDDATILSQNFNKSTDVFTPLVDVPDIVFKARVAGISRFPSENPNHYSDVDLVQKNGTKTLMQLSKINGNLTVDFWRQFYTDLGFTQPRSRGLLPFRVKQIFREMVKYLKANDTVGFVAAAGVLGHYIGDACQTLHGSQFTDGDSRPETEGIHSKYETAMININKASILSKLKSKIEAQETSTLAHNKINPISNEDEAAMACLHLLDVSMTRIPPQMILDTYFNAVTTGSKSQAVKKLWDVFGEETIESIARGSRTLAKVWEGAWVAAGAETNDAIKTDFIAQDKLKATYEDKEKFLKSYTLDQIGAYFNTVA